MIFFQVVAELRPLKEAKKSKRASPFHYPVQYISDQKLTKKVDIDQLYKEAKSTINNDILGNILMNLLKAKEKLIEDNIGGGIDS